MQTHAFQRWALAALIAMVGAIHLVTAPDQFNDATYKGLLFLANAAGAAVAAVALVRGDAWATPLGILIAGGAAAGYVVSRTVGLPGLPVDSNWLEPLGVLSLVAEGSFLLVTLASVGRRVRSTAAPSVARN